MISLLRFSHLHKSFPGRELLDLREFAIAGGEACVITGDNGSGKTTLMRILAGLEPAQIEGLSFRDAAVPANTYPADLRRDVVYVHQHPYLFRTSIADNIAYGLRARGVPRAERNQRVLDALKWSGMAHLAGVPPQKLSGGEKQRVALARAKVLMPQLFLLDEPTANLDGEARAQVIALIRQLVQDNSSLLIACHDREIIELPGMRRFHLENGKLAQS